MNFNKLIANNTNTGQHNREYFFTLIVTNNARLVNVDRIDILLDDSPPVPGVVFEGKHGEKDVDFTVSKWLFVHWAGFVDHESGIRMYEVAIAERCFTENEMKNKTNIPSTFVNTTLTETKFHVGTDGQYYISIIAYNNAMEPSKPICSDGIVVDSAPPILEELRIDHLKTTDILGCYRGTPYLIKDDLTAVQLPRTSACDNRCSNDSPLSMVSLIPKTPTPYNDTDYADHICKHNNLNNGNWFIYLPADKINMKWLIVGNSSQMDAAYVGFSRDISNEENPDLIAFEKTHTLSKFHRSHTGIDKGVPFFITIKLLNKAGVSSFHSVGPVIIDETPPMYTGGLAVEIQDSNVFVFWLNTSFKETEQKEEMTLMLFRVGK